MNHEHRLKITFFLTLRAPGGGVENDPPRFFLCNICQGNEIKTLANQISIISGYGGKIKYKTAQNFGGGEVQQ